MKTVSYSRVLRVRHEVKMREMVVVHIEALTPHFRSISFHSNDLEDFVSASFDDHVKVFFDAPGREPARRDYTPRRFDLATRTLTIEFALHGDGPAAEWAAQASLGQRLSIGGPRGSMIIPVDYDWHLLVGDESALPAIARRLEELPTMTRAIVLTQTSDISDRRHFGSAAVLEQRWMRSTDDLIAAVHALDLPPGDGFVWCAGESALSKTLRRVIVADKGHDHKAIRAAAYWKKGAVGHHENIED